MNHPLHELLAIALVVFAGCSQPATPVPGKTGESGQLRIKPVAVVVDPKTGFNVGGVNPTALIRQLTEINGRSIADLESVMRPGKLSEAGFLGPKESLLEVLAEDNRYVVQELGLTHQELAWHLRALVDLSGMSGRPNKSDWSDVITYQGQQFQVKLRAWKGYQESPFNDDLLTNEDATILNVESRRMLDFSLLVPLLIERYGFYEGKGTRYRVEPRMIVEVLGFMQPKPKR